MSAQITQLTPEQALVLSGVDSLPVDLGAVADYFCIKRVDYADCTKIYDITAEELYRAGKLGMSFSCEGQSVCAINENACGDRRRRWTLAHELGHCLLGHVSAQEPSPAVHTELEERSADRFAAGLLAPLTVLHYAGVTSAEQTAALCGISAKAAAIRFGQLCRARQTAQRQFCEAKRTGRTPGIPFVGSESDRRLLMRFLPFISNELCKRGVSGTYGFMC